MTGAVRVTTGTLSHGQSHETTLAQIVADRLGLPLGKVKIVQGDTDKITYGFGSFASRSVIIGGGAVAGAAVKLGEQLCSLAAHLMEIDVESVELDGDGGFGCAPIQTSGCHSPIWPTSPTCSRPCCPRTSGPDCGHRRVSILPLTECSPTPHTASWWSSTPHRRSGNPALRVRRGRRSRDQPESR